VVTTDLSTATAHVIGQGSVVEALLASAAIPGIFPPVTIDGRHLVDGGVAANTPLRQAEALGATDIFILTAATPGRSGGVAPVQIALWALGHMLREDTVGNRQGSPTRVHVVPTPPSPTGNFLDFRHGSLLIAESYRLTRQWIGELEPMNTTAA
jgi:NTE family protein